jgi:hypothetical protein
VSNTVGKQVVDRTKRTPEREEQFLEVLAAGWSVYKAARAIGVGRQTVYDWRNDGLTNFAQRWDEAVESGTDVMEDEAVRRAVHGVTRSVYYQGQPCGENTEYSDLLLDKQLRARRKEKYSDRTEQHVSQTVRIVEVTSYASEPGEES